MKPCAFKLRIMHRKYVGCENQKGSIFKQMQFYKQRFSDNETLKQLLLLHVERLQLSFAHCAVNDTPQESTSRHPNCKSLTQ